MAIKQGAISSTAKPTPIIHSCTPKPLFISKTVSDYNDRTLRFCIKEIKYVGYSGARFPKWLGRVAHT
jgi:hypothetical protein